MTEAHMINMKPIIRYLTAIFLLAVTTIQSHAYDFEVDGLCYSFNSDETLNVEGFYNEGFYNEALTIPEVVTYQGLRYTVTSIGVHAFWGCTNLTKVIIPNSVKEIYATVFFGCENLKEVVIPGSVTRIDSGVFCGCKNLIDVTIPDGLTEIPDGLFFGCSSLKEITIPEAVTTIGSKAFSGCSGLTELVIPEAVTEIQDSVFSGCSGLTEFVIPSSITKIDNYTFAYCTGLTELIIPNTITEIGYGAFANCTGLTELIIPNSASIDCDSEVINEPIGMFENCSNLRRVVLPKHTWTLHPKMFSGCSSLTDLTCNAINPPNCHSKAFLVFDKAKCTLHVPFGSEEKYREAAQWKDFPDIVGDAYFPVTSIDAEFKPNMSVGETQTITATVLPENAEDKTLIWSSSDETIATVDANGTVTAVAAGTVTITIAAADGSDVTKTCEITVTDAPDGIEGLTVDSVRVRVDGGEIVAEGVPAGLTVRVFAIDGVEVARAASTGAQLTFRLPHRGTYLVTFGSRCVKTAL